MKIKEVSHLEAEMIIETREPEGLFYTYHKGVGFAKELYIGIDNQDGHAWTEEFETKEECFNWLLDEPEPIEEKETYKAALAKWGKVPQVTIVFEEMAELQKELCKNLKGAKNLGNIAEEMADVEIMLGQMKELYNIEETVAYYKENKLRRLSAQIAGLEI